MERGWKPNTELAPPCPRCGSSNTKFCYYNNYSLTQPRYFCKACRRYWTKGGSLRNVPVGGGCRKSRRGKSARARTSATIQSISAAPEPSATIDLAAVYANFLTQPPPPQTTLSEFQSLQQAAESGFLECGSFPVRLSEFGGFGGQFSTATGMNQIDGDVLPPLPDMIMQNDEMLGGSATQQNSEVLNGNMMSPFSGFNLEAIFRS